MSIFQDEQGRLAASKRKKLAVENLQCPNALLLRGQSQVGIRRRVRYVEQLGIERNSLVQRNAKVLKRPLEPTELLGHGLRCANLEGGPQMLDDRPHGPVEV